MVTLDTPQPSSFTLDTLFRRQRSIQPVLQDEATECALACICMISSVYGCKIPLSVLRERYPVSVRGSNLLDIVDVLASLKLEAEGYQVDPEELAESARLPVIAHWNGNHFVIVTERKRNGWIVCDPAVGKLEVSDEVFAKSFSGIVLTVQTMVDFEPVEIIENRRSLFSHIVGATTDRQFLYHLFGISLIFELLTILLPLATQLIVDHVIDIGSLADFNLIFIAVTAVLTLRLASGTLKDLAARRFQISAYRGLSSSFLSSVLRLPLDVIEKRHASDIIVRLQYARSAYLQAVQTINDTFLGALFGFASLILVLTYSALIGSIVFVLSISYIGFQLYLSEQLRNKTRARQKHLIDSHQSISETVRGLRYVRMNSIETARQIEFDEDLSNAMQFEHSILGIKATGRAVQRISESLSILTIIWFGTGYVLKGDITVGMFVAMMGFSMHWLTAMGRAFDSYLQLCMFSTELERANDVVRQAEDGLAANVAPAKPKTADASIDVKDLSYRYAGETKDILSDVNLHIPAGKRVALMGPSGSGKSTLLRLISGLIKPSKGEVRLFGRSIAQVGWHAYQQELSYFQQDEELFSSSIKNNITGFETAPDPGQLKRAIKGAGLADYLSDLPMGLETVVMGGGVNFSGGQNQRILLARALYRNPRILLLDESTSHLDEDIEAHIMASLQKISATVLMATHRSTTRKYFDDVIHLDRGGFLNPSEVQQLQ